MLSELSSVIIREIILRFDDYQSILNFKIINKRFFKFINNDTVIQRYYLKLRYNVVVKDNNLLKIIKLLDFKLCSEFIEQYSNAGIFEAFTNPINENFILSAELEEHDIHYIISSENNKNVDDILKNKKANFEKMQFFSNIGLDDNRYMVTENILKNEMLNCKQSFLFSQGYFLLHSNILFSCSNIINELRDIKERTISVKCKNGKIFIIERLPEQFNEKIVSKLESMVLSMF